MKENIKNFILYTIAIALFISSFYMEHEEWVFMILKMLLIGLIVLLIKWYGFGD